MFVNTNKYKGFTLIELLITISILAVLSTIGMLLYQGVLAKTRDATRKSDLNKLASALEIYYQDNSQYIDDSLRTQLDCSSTSADITRFYDSNPDMTKNKGIAPKLSDNIVPKDPKDQSNYCYISVTVNGKDSQSFTLCANLENTTDPDYVGNGCGSTNYHYVVTPK